jgi:hypothetical protein
MSLEPGEVVPNRGRLDDVPADAKRRVDGDDVRLRGATACA